VTSSAAVFEAAIRVNSMYDTIVIDKKEQERNMEIKEVFT